MTDREFLRMTEQERVDYMDKLREDFHKRIDANDLFARWKQNTQGERDLHGERFFLHLRN